MKKIRQSFLCLMIAGLFLIGTGGWMACNKSPDPEEKKAAEPQLTQQELADCMEYLKLKKAQRLRKQQVGKPSLSRPSKKVAKEEKAKQEVKDADKKNMILFTPSAFMAYSMGYKRPIFAPALTVTYLREIAPQVWIGPTATYGHFIYPAIHAKNRANFNMVGVGLTAGYKF